ncbi:MAG: UbiA family prenyltransferase [Burkholderiales bacterium]|nr:UbiA family prenyltransferase [Burkholderiales bacterium]
MTSLKNRLDAYEQLLHLHRPLGILLLLWPILSALWLATGGRPPLSLVIIFVMGTLLMRSAACAFNDGLNRSGGCSAQGVIAPWEALVIASGLTLIAFCFAWFTTGFATGLLAAALVLALGLALLYWFFKCAFSLSQAFLGIVFSFGIPIAFAAANNTVPWYGWALMGITIFWVAAYDIEYAMANRDKDLERGRRSSALILGHCDVPAVAICYGLYLAGMAAIGLWLRLGIAYGIALVLATVGAAGFLWLIRRREASRCLTVFRHNHWVGMLIFIGIVADYALRLHAWPILGR